MQAYVEIMLVAILIVVLFNGPISGIREFANSVLGKALLVCLIIVVSHQFGTNAGLLMAGITIVLLNNNIEGFKGKEGVAFLDCGINGENCENQMTDLKSNTVDSQAASVGGSQSGSPDQDEKPDVERSTEERGGKLKAKKIRKRIISRAPERNAERPVKVAAVVRPTDIFSKEKEVSKKDKAQVKDIEKAKIKEIENDVVEDKDTKDKAKVKEIKEEFSNFTLDNAADYTNLGSTLAAYSTNDNIMSSMRASEYAKTAPGGCALMTNHIDTMRVVNNPRSEGIF